MKKNLASLSLLLLIGISSSSAYAGGCDDFILRISTKGAPQNTFVRYSFNKQKTAILYPGQIKTFPKVVNNKAYSGITVPIKIETCKTFANKNICQVFYEGKFGKDFCGCRGYSKDEDATCPGQPQGKGEVISEFKIAGLRQALGECDHPETFNKACKSPPFPTAAIYTITLDKKKFYPGFH